MICRQDLDWSSCRGERCGIAGPIICDVIRHRTTGSLGGEDLVPQL